MMSYFWISENQLIPLRLRDSAVNKKAPAGGAFLILFKNVASCRNYADGPALPGAAYFELDVAIGGCKKRVVAAHADIVTGVKLGAALTNQDVACQNVFAAKLFHTQPLGF
jgi:hypothetical protein